MDTRSSAIGIVATLLLVMVFTSAGFPNPVSIYSSDFNLPIPSPNDPESEYGRGWMADAVIEVPDHFVISDLDVGINVTHTSALDLQIFLQSPSGNEICLNMYNYDEFFVGENYTDTIFDDEALLSIKDGVPPFTGRFRPVEIDPYNKLSKFDGEDTCGSWRLRIYDAFYNDTGTFNHFELIITAPEPATAILLTLGVCLMYLHRPHHNIKKLSTVI